MPVSILTSGNMNQCIGTGHFGLVGKEGEECPGFQKENPPSIMIIIGGLVGKLPVHFHEGNQKLTSSLSTVNQCLGRTQGIQIV